MTRELPIPCDHAPSSWAYRMSSHSDAEIDAAGGVAKIAGPFSSVWTCARPKCVDAAERYIAYQTKRVPVRNVSLKHAND